MVPQTERFGHVTSNSVDTLIRDRLKPLFLVSAVAESGAVSEVQLWP